VRTLAPEDRTVTRRSFLQVVAAALVPTGCNLNPEPPLRVGANIWPGYECLFIARSLGFFQEAPIKLVEYPSTPEVIRAFKNRAIEVAAMTTDEFLRLAAEQEDLKAILVTDISKGADAVIGRADDAAVTDLRGKKVGVEINALGVYLLTRALACAGLRREDVEIVPVESDQHLAAFQQGRIDAVVSFEPYRSRLLKIGGKVLFDSGNISGEIQDVLITRETVLETRSGAIRTVLEGWFKARERLLNEPEETARLVTARENVTAPEFLRFLELMELPSLDKNKQMLARNGTVEHLSAMHSKMIQSGLIRGPLEVKNLVDGGFLP
jgi:NitT/TauT family transport system substrate-binding protein